MSEYNRDLKIQKIIKKRVPSFPQKFEEMLNSNKHYDCICWSEDGSEIIIKNKSALNEILPSYFKTHKLTSFNRQLHVFGFKQRKNELNQVVICHPSFTRNINQLQIKQKEIKLTIYGQQQKIKNDLSLILAQQQQLQRGVVILMQIQNKIQNLYQTMLKVRIQYIRYICKIKQSFLLREINIQDIFLVYHADSQRQENSESKPLFKFSEVLSTHREFIQSCFEEPEEEWMNDHSMTSQQQSL